MCRGEVPRRVSPWHLACLVAQRLEAAPWLCRWNPEESGNMSATVQLVQAVDRTGIAVLHVQGRLDAHATQKLIARCIEVQAGSKRLVLDLSGVTFLSSNGVGAMLMLTEQFRERGGDIR